ncbi:MAG: hypothetical protein JXM68_12120, partial [Sedimentisphaerales bacterium]|nr:hypothetical protein [Sedimentisphaerales bacterium]
LQTSKFPGHFIKLKTKSSRCKSRRWAEKLRSGTSTIILRVGDLINRDRFKEAIPFAGSHGFHLC